MCAHKGGLTSIRKMAQTVRRKISTASRKNIPPPGLLAMPKSERAQMKRRPRLNTQRSAYIPLSLVISCDATAAAFKRHLCTLPTHAHTGAGGLGVQGIAVKLGLPARERAALTSCSRIDQPNGERGSLRSSPQSICTSQKKQYDDCTHAASMK